MSVEGPCLPDVSIPQRVGCFHTMIIMRSSYFLIAGLVCLLDVCGCGTSPTTPLPDGKVVLQISRKDKETMLSRLGLTNILYHGPVERDSSGTRLFVRVETGLSFNPVQELRTQQLVVVSSEGAHITPWHFPANERVGDDEKVAAWQNPAPQSTWQVQSGEVLSNDCYIADVSGDWIAVEAKARSPWIAKLSAPNVPVVEFPESPGLIAIYARGQVVHVFLRRGWRNDEGPMKYLVYDFAKAGSKPVKEMTLPPWARITLDMDPESGFVVINDNNSFGGRTWLFDLKTKKRKHISSAAWTLIVTKEVAKKWLEFAK
jgi:hypothetical protein